MGERASGGLRRIPRWSNAIVQAQTAARSLLHPETPPHVPDHYFWTEQFGVDVRTARELPILGAPDVIQGDLSSPSALLQ